VQVALGSLSIGTAFAKCIIIFFNLLKQRFIAEIITLNKQ
jgi:hypothetical protein